LILFCFDYFAMSLFAQHFKLTAGNDNDNDNNIDNGSGGNSLKPFGQV